MTKRRWSMPMTAVLAVAAVGCAGGGDRFSPVGPSPVAEIPAATAAPSAAVWASAHGWSTMADGRVAVADGVVVEAVDVLDGVSGECPSRTVTVRGVPVSVTATTSFTAPLSCGTLAGGQAVRITGVLLQSGSGFVVTATHLASAAGGASGRAPGTNRGGEKLAGEGIVGAVAGSCPSLTFVILGHRVQTTPDTVYTNGSCETMRHGAHVHLAVDRQPDGSIFAEAISFRSVPAGN